MTVDIDNLPAEAKIALQQFQEFQIESFNDSGANSYVMIGRHNVLHKDVAIKIYFHEEHEVDQEPAIIAEINHENVLKVYDARKLNKNCSFYMMQSANDGDLFSFLEKYNLSLIFSHKLLCQLLSGLSALHCEEKKLVHRDLKPENLLVHNNTIVIADFGSVRRVNEATGQVPASKHSVLNRPPEACGEDAFFDFASDIYQTGIIGYLLFGGDLSNNLLEHLSTRERNELGRVKDTADNYEISAFIDFCIAKKVSSGKLLDWNSLPFYVPKKVKRVLKGAVSNHDKRYKNTSEFLSELAKIKTGLPDWMVSSKGYELMNWKGNDYLLIENNSQVILKKRKHGMGSFRVDNSVKAESFVQAYELLQLKIGLP